MLPNWSKEVAVNNSKMQSSTFPRQSETRQKLVDDLNPLYQSPSSISSKLESMENGEHITYIQERCTDPIFLNFLNSMLPN